MPDTPRALPDFTSWPSFPFEGDLRVKPLDALVDIEPARTGEDPANCPACTAPDEAYIYVNERWRVRAMDRPSGLPMVLILESRTHLDLGDLPNMLAAELGVMTVRLERAVRSLDGVARVHVNRWGDGSAHLHLWFLARPHGRLQLRGTFLSLWDDILPVISEAQWRENLALVAAWLAEFGGTPLAQPPRIDWKAPSSLAQSPVAEATAADATAGDPATAPATATAPADPTPAETGPAPQAAPAPETPQAAPAVAQQRSPEALAAGVQTEVVAESPQGELAAEKVTAEPPTAEEKSPEKAAAGKPRANAVAAEKPASGKVARPAGRRAR